MNERLENGQVLVLVALSMLVLFAFLALAVDGGSIYRERRAMQNAADAGALAGAQELCFGDPALVPAVAREFAIDRNGAEGADVTVSGLVSVTVVATETYRTYFAGLIGFREFPVQADATAVCARASAGGGLWPIAFDATRWPEDTELNCGQQMIMWDDDRADCDVYNCCKVFDSKKNAIANICEDGEDRPAIHSLDGRAYIDFTAGISGNDPCDSGGCGTSEIVYRIDGTTNKGELCENFVVIGECYAMPTGITSAPKAIESNAGRIVNIPLYDPCASGENASKPFDVIGDLPRYPSGYCPETAQVCQVNGSTCSNGRYKIDRLACLQIGIEVGTGWTSYVYLMEAYGSSTLLPAVKILVGTIPCEPDGSPHEQCSSSLGWTYGAAPRPGDVRAVSLVD